MTSVKIRGIDVKFPHEKPYDLQIDFMDKVIQCLEEQKHGVLESPTGTGKTLCLFAPVAAWLQSQKMSRGNHSDNQQEMLQNAFPGLRKTPRVWYTSRTHSQIAQTIAEVRRCNIEGLSLRVMGARDQLCINPDVLQEKESYIKSVKCKELVKQRACRFHRNLDFAKQAPEIYQPGEILDIEDLVSRGRSCGICPYHLARSARESADIILMPYNYVIDRESRGDDDGSFQNGVIIFDEGHNVPNTCEESYEFSLTSVDLALGISNIKELMESIANLIKTEVDDNDSPVDFATHADNCIKILKVFTNLESQLAAFPVFNEHRSLQDLLHFFKKAEVTPESSSFYLECLAAFIKDSARLQLSGPMITTFKLLTTIMETLFGAAIQSFDSEVAEKSFKFIISQDTETVKNSKKLSLFCFNPSFGIKEVMLLGIRSMIITSGTLSPLKNFAHELGLPNTITLVNSHIATKDQIPFIILGTGVNNSKMDASFKNRTTEGYMHSLGMTLTNLICSVPDGVLLLFSSYSVMRTLQEYWEGKSGIWARLNYLKRVFLEPKNKDDFINCMENYRRAIDSGNGAILMGVLRGKISEGMDFKNQYCRGVFIVGVPFPPVMDPRVKGKIKYAESLRVENPVTQRIEPLYANGSFLCVEAMKATNQAIGRVIRHAQDYGAIVLVDYRFARPNLYQNISHWLREERPVEVNFPIAKKTIREFFKQLHAGNLAVPEVRVQELSASGDPIPACVKYDMYDHKKVMRHNAPFIGSSLDNGQYSRAYGDDSVSSGISDNIYKRNIGNNTESSSSPISRASLDLLESEDAYRSRMSLFATGIENIDGSPKRKCDNTPSYSSRKKPRRHFTSIGSFSKGPEPVLAPASTKEIIRTDIISYIQQVKNMLPVNDGLIFKETVWKYMKGDAPLPQTIATVENLLASVGDKISLLHGFAKCVLSKDKKLWEEITRNWI